MNLPKVSPPKGTRHTRPYWPWSRMDQGNEQ